MADDFRTGLPPNARRRFERQIGIAFVLGLAIGALCAAIMFVVLVAVGSLL